MPDSEKEKARAMKRIEEVAAFERRMKPVDPERLHRWRSMVLDNVYPLCTEWLEVIQLEKIVVDAMSFICEYRMETGEEAPRKQVNFLMDTALALCEQLNRTGKYVGVAYDIHLQDPVNKKSGKESTSG